MASKKTPNPSDTEAAPFGAGAIEDGDLAVRSTRETSRKKRSSRSGKAPADGDDSRAGEDRGGERAERPARGDAPAKDGHEAAERPREGSGHEDGRGGSGRRRRRRWQERRNKRKNRRPHQGERDGAPRERDGGPREGGGGPREGGGGPRPAPAEVADGAELAEGVLLVEKANHGHLRRAEKGFVSARDDVHVSPRLIQKYGLREGALVKGPRRRGQGRHKWDLADVTTVDGKDPREVRNLPAFKSLTSIDPDFHYQVGDGSGEVSLKVVDLLCPVGRGQRGLIVASPRSGKTILLQQFARAIETIYPEVHLMVLLVDERPEEATEWKRATQGEVYVSTNDEPAKRHVDLCEVVWKRCQRLVELGEDVILLIDSITRMGRAYNNVRGNSGKTMSGGIDTRALERPKQLFGSARNTETAGSLTILATALIETGSRMDQVIFEEFKGTGNMELVLSRKLADRRIFPAIDVEKTGTRKEEKLLSSRRLKRVNTLRRVLTRMHWAEAMELLVSKLDEVERIDDFLERFEVDPEA